MTMLDTAGNIKPLVERLRQAAQEGREIIEPWDHDPNLFDEAAAEIERLRAVLKEIAKMPTWTGQGSGFAASIARDALGGDV